MLKNKQRVKGNIIAIEANGAGIFFQGRDKILVRNVLLNEEVEVEIEKRVKEGYVANLIKIFNPSIHRVKEKCSYYKQCGSCHLLHVNYKQQLVMKKQMVMDMLKKEKMTHISVHDCEGMDHPYEYRNKIIISFGKRKKDVVAGFYGEFSHRIIPIKNCLLHESYTNQLIEDIKSIVKKCRIEAFDEDRRIGFLRHILIRRGVATNQSMLVLVGAEKIFKAKNNFLKELKRLHPEINTVVFNYNPRKTSVVLGNDEFILYGKGYIEDILCGKRFKISSKSFYQINHEQCEKLYTRALSLVDFNGNETMIDAYCGIGTIGLIASDKVKQVYSVELNKDAIKDAIGNAKMNHITNVIFKCEDAGKYMLDIARTNRKIDVVIMDPARDGSDEKFLSSLVKLSPKQVVYISCNPQTQIRDIKYLSKFGYECKELYPYDLFPNTFHVECACLLLRK